MFFVIYNYTSSCKYLNSYIQLIQLVINCRNVLLMYHIPKNNAKIIRSIYYQLKTIKIIYYLNLNYYNGIILICIHNVDLSIILCNE